MWNHVILYQNSWGRLLISLKLKHTIRRFVPRHQNIHWWVARFHRHHHHLRNVVWMDANDCISADNCNYRHSLDLIPVLDTDLDHQGDRNRSRHHGLVVSRRRPMLQVFSSVFGAPNPVISIIVVNRWFWYWYTTEHLPRQHNKWP